MTGDNDYDTPIEARHGNFVIRRHPDTMPARPGPLEAFDDEISSDDWLARHHLGDPAHIGPNSNIVNLVFHSRCSGYNKVRPAAKDLYEGMRAAEPNPEQPYAMDAWLTESNAEEQWHGWLERAYSWRMLARAMHLTSYTDRVKVRKLNAEAVKPELIPIRDRWYERRYDRARKPAAADRLIAKRCPAFMQAMKDHGADSGWQGVRQIVVRFNESELDIWQPNEEQRRHPEESSAEGQVDGRISHQRREQADAEQAAHNVEVGNLIPGPAVPAATAVLLGAVLAGLGAVRRRRVATSGSLVLAGILAVPAAASAQYSAAEAAQKAESTADAPRADAARGRPEGRRVHVVPSESVLLSPAELAGAMRGIRWAGPAPPPKKRG